MTSERQRCIVLRKDGLPCQAFAIKDGLCVGHLPESNEARRKGGKNSAKKIRADKLLPLRLVPILEALEKALIEVYQGKLDHRRGTAMASIASSMIRLYETAILEDRLIKLEKIVNMRNDGS